MDNSQPQVYGLTHGLRKEYYNNGVIKLIIEIDQDKPHEFYQNNFPSDGTETLLSYIEKGNLYKTYYYKKGVKIKEE